MSTFVKGLDVIRSCTNIYQLHTARKYLELMLKNRYINYSGWCILYSEYIVKLEKLNLEDWLSG